MNYKLKIKTIAEYTKHSEIIAAAVINFFKNTKVIEFQFEYRELKGDMKEFILFDICSKVNRYSDFGVYHKIGGNAYKLELANAKN